MENSNMDNYPVLEYYSMMARKKRMPFSGTFELTPKCNMNCKMCYIRMNDEEMKKVGTQLSIDEWLSIAKEASENGMTEVLLTGGEAVLYKDFKKLYLELRKLGLFIAINTNGTTLTDDLIDFFKSYPPTKINITIYGASNDTYTKLCNNPKGFDQVCHAIRKLKENHINIEIHCCLTKENSFDIKNIFEFVNKNDLKIEATSYNFPAIRKEWKKEIVASRMNEKEAAKTRLLINWYSKNKDEFITYLDSTISNVENFVKPDLSNLIGSRVLCGAGRSGFWITWDGRMLGCGMDPSFSVNVKDGFLSSWRKIVKHTDNILLDAQCECCKYKKICQPCAAKLKSESGFYNKKGEYLCKYSEEYYLLLKEAKKYISIENNIKE